MLLRRIISSLVLIPVVSIPAYLNGPLYWGLLSIVALLAANEYDVLWRHSGHPPLRMAGLALLYLFLADAIWPTLGLIRYGAPLFIMLSLAYLLRASDWAGGLINWGLTLAGAFYIGGLLSQFIALRNLPYGLELSALAAFITWTSDVSAYFVGTRFGRHRLAPRISPKKSWEGALGGCILATAMGVLWGIFALPTIPIYHLISLSALIVLAGIVGDLAESFIKRQVGAKDAGEFIPGHGGVLDRIDSLLFALPTTFLYATLILNMQ